MEKDFSVDDQLIGLVKKSLLDNKEKKFNLKDSLLLNNRNKSVGGQLAIDIERTLNYYLEGRSFPSLLTDHRGRSYLQSRSVNIKTHGSAGQSYGAFCNDGMVLEHTGTCNDG